MGVSGEEPPAVKPLAVTIITGHSGAGKSTALKVLEDQGFFCVDNLPAFLLPELINGLPARHPGVASLAVVMDSRDPAFPAGLTNELARLGSGPAFRLLFLEAEEEVLLKRYSQLRRVHPLTAGSSLRESIRREGEQLAPFRTAAEEVIDTSAFTPHELRRRLLHWLDLPSEKQALRILLLSFGFKHGLPEEVDLLFDVRFLPNPYFVPALSGKTGLEAEVAGHVLENPAARRFFDLLQPLLSYLVPAYRQEGKKYLTIGIGCTGGRHRSVAVAEMLAKLLQQAGEGARASHRDVEKG